MGWKEGRKRKEAGKGEKWKRRKTKKTEKEGAQRMIQ